MLEYLIYSKLCFDCNSEYVVLTRSWLKQYELYNIVKWNKL